MRVLHVMEATIGGTRRHLTDLAREQRRQGFEVHVVAAAERAPDFREDLAALEAEGCGVLELPMVRSIAPLQDHLHCRALQREIARVRPDVVHTHSSKAGVLGRLASLRERIGVRVHTPHTFAFLFEAMFGSLKRRLFRGIEGYFGARTDRLVAVSEGEAETIRRSGVVPPERVRVVPNGIDLEAWRARLPDAAAARARRASWQLPEGALVGAVVGLLNRAKGQDLALRALAHEGAEEVALVFAGEGDDLPLLESLVEEIGLEDRVRLLGWVDDVPGLLLACDFCLIPSRWEGLPYIALEAAAAGLPLVGAPVDGVRDVLAGEPRAGVLAASSQPAELARAMGELFRRSPLERADLGASALERVRGEFTVERMVERLTAVYEECLGR